METKADLLEVLDMMCSEAPSQLQWDRNRIADEFADVSVEIVRPRHARDVLENGQREVMNIGGHRFVMAAKSITIKDKSCTVFVLAHADMDAMFLPQIVIDAGYRLYGSAEEVERWSSSPRQAFAEMLDRYGIRFEIEGQRLLWLPMMMVTLPEAARDDPEKVARYIFRGFGFESLDDLPEHAFIARVGTGEDGRLLVAGPTMLDLARYRADVQQRR